MSNDKPPHVKIPHYENDAQAWLIQLNLMFRAYKIDDELTRLQLASAGLPPAIINDMSDILMDPPSSTPFKIFSENLIKRQTDSQQKQIQDLLTDEKLGDRKPSQLLRQFKQKVVTANLSIDESLLKHLFIERMPDFVRQGIILLPDSTALISVADAADKLVDSMKKTTTHGINVVTTHQPDDKLDKILKALENLTVEIKRAHTHTHNERAAGASRSKSRPRSQSRPRSNRTYDKCWYHWKFGAAATKCVPPCTESDGLNQDNCNDFLKPQDLYSACQCYTENCLLLCNNVNSTTCPSYAKLFTILDNNSNLNFLIDTGALFSLWPLNVLGKISSPRKINFNLQAANGTEIKTHGVKTHTLKLKNRAFSWDFIVCDVKTPILGIDFLSHFGFVLDIKNQILKINTETIQINPSQINSINLTCKFDDPFKKLLNNYPEIIATQSKMMPIKHSVEHIIETTGPPLACRPRRLSPEKLKIAKAEVDQMLRLGIIEPSSSSWSSPIHMVPKKNPNEYRVVGDFRKLNAVTRHDSYPLTFLQDVSSELHGKNIFSKIDCHKAFYNIPLSEESREKSSFSTPFGLFQYRRMAMGLTNASQTWVRFIHEVFRGLPFAVYVFVDDILLASEDAKSHIEQLTMIFQRLRDFGILINLEKSELGVSELEFIGYKIDKNGLSPLDSKVEAIKNFPLPTTKRQLQKFCGMLSFYFRFSKNLADILSPLYKLGAAAKFKNSKLNWSDENKNSFQQAKNSLANATLLAHPNPKAQLSIFADSSSTAVGAVLQQTYNGTTEPLAFFSRALNNAQRNYSTFSRELLAAYLAIRQFQYMVEGKNPIIYTDHLALTKAMQAKNSQHSPREARQIDYISQITTDIRWVNADSNQVADTLSRFNSINSITEISSSIDYITFAKDQLSDPIIKNLIGSTDSVLKLKNVYFDKYKVSILCDMSTKIARLIVPSTYYDRIFVEFHNMAHIGANATIRMITRNFVWPKMKKFIRNKARTCIECQSSKVGRHTVSPLQAFPAPSSRLEHIHLDLVGPLTPSKNCRYILTIIDRFTRWPEAIPIPDMSSQTVANAFVHHWVARYGIPITMTTDLGGCFESYLWKELMALLGINRTRSTSYRPQTSGFLERFHRILKASIKAHASPTNWVDLLPLILLNLRNTVREGIGIAPAEILYGTTLRMPGELLVASPEIKNTAEYVHQLRRYMKNLKPVPPRIATNRNVFISKDLYKTSHVFLRIDRVRGVLEKPFQGPYPVLARSKKYFKINRDGKKVNISIDRLKPAFMDQAPDYIDLDMDNYMPVPEQLQPQAAGLVPPQPRVQPPPRRLAINLRPQVRQPRHQPNPNATPGRPIIRTRTGRQVTRPDFYGNPVPH